MNKLRTIITTTFLILLITIQGCKKEDTNQNQNPEATVDEVTYSPNADGLLGMSTSKTSGDKVYLYGTWKTDGSVEKFSAVSYAKSGSDTVVVYKLNAAGDSVAYAYFSVGNQVQNRLFTFNQLSATDVDVDIFDYNWTTQSSSFVQQVQIKSGKVLKTDEIFNTGQATGLIASLPSAVVSALRVTVLTGTFVAIAVACPPCAAAGTVVGILYPTNASASTATTPPAVNTPNPTQQPPAVVPTSPCDGVSVAFVASMDGVGSVLIANPLLVSGYEYSLNNSPFQQSQVFNGPYSPGYFTISIKTASGCIKTETRYIDSLSLLDKLIQWGPWKGTTYDDGEPAGFAVYTFSATTVLIKFYYLDGNLEWEESIGMTLTGNTIYIQNRDPLDVVSISPTLLKIEKGTETVELTRYP